jgi:hypothetical protein
MQFDADDVLVEPPTDLTSEFDATATPNSGPPPSSNPGDAQEPLRESGEEQPTTSADKGTSLDPAEFDERHREPFTGLLYLGRLIEDVTIWGHAFRLCTPSHRERLQIGQVIKAYADTPSEDASWMACLVAAYLIEVDDEPLPEPVVKNKGTALHDRFGWVIDNLHTPVINELFDRCLAMDTTVRKVLSAMGEA